MSRRDNDETVLVDNLTCVAETDKALCVTVGSSTKDLWLPKSHIRGGNVDKPGDRGSLEMTAWIHGQKFDGMMGRTRQEEQTGEERVAAANTDGLERRLAMAEAHLAQQVRITGALIDVLQELAIELGLGTESNLSAAILQARRLMSTAPIDQAAARNAEKRDEQFAVVGDDEPVPF